MPNFTPREPAPALTTSFHTDTCGTCKFANPIVEDINMVECRGAPPTPLFAPMQNGGVQLVLMRPRMPRAEGACGQHQRKLAVNGH